MGSSTIRSPRQYSSGHHFLPFVGTFSGYGSGTGPIGGRISSSSGPEMDGFQEVNQYYLSNSFSNNYESTCMVLAPLTNKYYPVNKNGEIVINADVIHESQQQRLLANLTALDTFDLNNLINGRFPRLLYTESLTTNVSTISGRFTNISGSNIVGDSTSRILPNIVPMLGVSSNFYPNQDYYRKIHGAKYCKFAQNNGFPTGVSSNPPNSFSDGYLFKSKEWTPTRCEYIAAVHDGIYFKMSKIRIMPGPSSNYSGTTITGTGGFGAGIYADKFSALTAPGTADTTDVFASGVVLTKVIIHHLFKVSQDICFGQLGHLVIVTC